MWRQIVLQSSVLDDSNDENTRMLATKCFIK